MPAWRTRTMHSPFGSGSGWRGRKARVWSKAMARMAAIVTDCGRRTNAEASCAYNSFQGDDWRACRNVTPLGMASYNPANPRVNDTEGDSPADDAGRVRMTDK